MSVRGTLTVNSPLDSSKPNVKREGLTKTLKIGLPPSVLVGNVAAYAMRIRDRFGNLMGLGPLPQ